MALGIDIYRKFQTVTSWPAVKQAGVTFAYVKLSDGGGMPAGGRGDAEVRGAKSVGIPVGGYHFVQANPGPAAQADVLLGEVRRLDATGCVPMLDLEDNPASSGLPNIPDSQKAAFGKAFCSRIAEQGFRPGVYMNNALAKLLRPDRWGIPGLVIWIARYGAKPDAAAGRYDIHQYSSSGSIPGISAGGVDLDESYTTNHLTNSTEDDMWTQADFNTPLFTDNPNTPQARTIRFRDWAGELRERVASLVASNAALSAAIAAATKNPAITADMMKEIVNDAVAQNLRITGTVEITGAEQPAAAGQ